MSEPEALAMALGQSRVLAPSECVKCGAELSDREQERYISELRDWAQRHPGAWTDCLPGDLGDVASQHPYDRVLPDCERCASGRLLKNRKTQEARGFWDKVADGEKEGFIVVDVGLLIICVILKGCWYYSAGTLALLWKAGKTGVSRLCRLAAPGMIKMELSSGSAWGLRRVSDRRPMIIGASSPRVSSVSSGDSIPNS